MLFAGAGANETPALGGALPFAVNSSPSRADWYYGSAFLLLAGACANSTLAMGGALTFDAGGSPSNPWWGDGSASF